MFTCKHTIIFEDSNFHRFQGFAVYLFLELLKLPKALASRPYLKILSTKLSILEILTPQKKLPYSTATHMHVRVRTHTHTHTHTHTQTHTHTHTHTPSSTGICPVKHFMNCSDSIFTQWYHITSCHDSIVHARVTCQTL